MSKKVQQGSLDLQEILAQINKEQIERSLSGKSKIPMSELRKSLSSKLSRMKDHLVELSKRGEDYYDRIDSEDRVAQLEKK